MKKFILILAGALAFFDLFAGGSGEYVVYGVALGTIASGVGTPTTLQIQYCPQYLYWIQTAAVDVNIRVLGDGTTFDVAAAGIAELGVVRQLGRFTNAYVLPIANGLLQNKTTTITITNQVASAFTLYGWSENQGNSFIQGVTQNCLASSGVDITNVAFAAFPAAGATDQFNVTFADGTNQQFVREELRAKMQRYQNVINAAGYNMDNIFMNEILKINFIPTAAQNAYFLRYVRASGFEKVNSLVSRGG